MCEHTAATYCSRLALALAGGRTLVRMNGGVVVAFLAPRGSSRTAPGASRLMAAWLLRGGHELPCACLGGVICHAVRAGPRVRRRSPRPRPAVPDLPWGDGRPHGRGLPSMCGRRMFTCGGAHCSSHTITIRPTSGWSGRGDPRRSPPALAFIRSSLPCRIPTVMT